MDIETKRPHRVVQWATGNIGARSLRAVIEHPNLELVGLYVHSDDKVGRDAGALCALGPTGVIATRDVEEIITLKPDCVLYMADRADIDIVCRLLESGANVVSTRSEFHHPAGLAPAVRQQIDAACQRGGATLHSTGSSPGFITEALPIVLTSLQRHLDGLTIDEFADLSSRNSPELLFDLMGFGKDPAEFDSRRFGHGAVALGPSLRALADAISLPLEDVESTGEVATARRTVEISAGTVETGTVAAQRMIVSGMRNRQALVRFRATWYCATDIEPAWDLRETGWHLLLEGDLPLEVDIRFPVSPEEWAATSPGVTAHRAVNAISNVCSAAPGIRTTAELPQIIPALG
jgi:4-hydroxy-tetrahydrodipicolinate reductase